MCDLHFKDSDVVKKFVHDISGDVVAILCEKWTLKEDVVPCLFPNCPPYLSKTREMRETCCTDGI